MPVESTEIELGLPVKAEEFEILSMGHIPRATEDHWFMYFDGDVLFFHRSWTGICIYKVHVEHAKEGDGYVLSQVTVNRDCGQYSETNDESDRILVLILIGQALGKDVESLWEAHHRIGHGERPAMNSATTTVLGFWQAGEANGYLSNWSDAGFELMERRFSTTEHWIMWQKARVMGDESTAAAILKAHGPKQAKALGGQASPYDDVVWCDVREELAYVGVRETFLQNPDLARQLLATGDLVLAEASPYDHVWGVGISVSDKGFSDMTGWNGQNLQGRICMRVRADLRMLMPDGPTRHVQGTDKDDIEAVLASTVGKMSLLALARNPLTRSAALCYARIAGHASQMQDKNVHHFLMDRGCASLATIDKDVRVGAKHYFSETGWYELLVQLAFLRRVGLL